MRKSCLFCARKHLGQAYVLCEEAVQGYPEHIWLAIGHMAEAGAELVMAYPVVAAKIRDERLMLEKSWAESKEHPKDARPLALPDFMALIKMLDTAVPVMPEAAKPAALTGTPPPSVGSYSTPKPRPQPHKAASDAVGCGTCFDNARKTRWALENQTLREKYPHGRLLILTTLANFSPSYSLTSVILDQAVAAAAAGYRVTIGVHVGCDLSEMPPTPPSIDVIGIIPKLHLIPNTINDEQVRFVVDAIRHALTALGPCKIISHDLLFQESFCSIAKAIHVLPRMEGVEWFHLCHSSVGVKDPVPAPDTPQIYRRTLPDGHKILILNYSDTIHFQRYYRTSANGSPVDSLRIKTLLNPRDCRVFQGMNASAVSLISKHTPHLVDVAQVYPMCLTRIEYKHPEHTLELFGEFKRLGQSVRLIFATANANAKNDLQNVIKYKDLARSKGLTDEEVVFTHESLPETSTRGLDRAAIRSLFSVTNLFAFPSESEAGSLVLMEAAQSGNLLVLNESLPCLRDYIPPEMALWVPWGSIKEPGRTMPLQPLAERILDRLDRDMSMKSKRHMLKLSSLEAYGERLVEVLGG